MKRIVVATNNMGKLKEFKTMLAFCEVVCPKELGIDFDVDETGETFFENASIKARALYEICGCPTIADDSGLCVDALGGAPGVYSARYSGGGDKANNAKLLDELKDKADRSAHFTSCIVYYDGKNEYHAEGRTYGKIGFEPVGNGGFGYDPLFISDDLRKTFGQASDAEKNTVSHRSRALQALKDILSEID